jgi:SAM-dependent methyltransferase
MTAAGLPARVFGSAIKPSYVRLRRAFTGLLFERRYGVSTEGRLSAGELGLPRPNFSDYMPYGWLSLRRALPRSEVSTNDVFLDVGSGMGRVVLLAAMSYPFQRVLGVEISGRLHEIALRNLDISKARLQCPVDLLQADVLDIGLPDDVTVVFLYNSLTGTAFQEFIDRLLRSVDRNPRPVRLIYANPKEAARLLATDRVRLVRTVRGWRPASAWSTSNSTRMYVILPGPTDPTRRRALRRAAPDSP